jgi:NAD(P)H-hydrate epimerase
MAKPENALYRCEQIRTCERLSHDVLHLDERELMARAGEEAFRWFQNAYPKVQHIAVFCGAGNNAGDGYAFAQLAQEQGYSVVLYQCKPIEELPWPAKEAGFSALASGVPCLSAEEPIDAEVELIVDALLGIGLKGPVRGLIAEAISHINASGLPVISLDIPSGLNADTGESGDFCVKADATLTFIALKTGMHTLDGPDYCGSVYCFSLGLEVCRARLQPVAYLLDTESQPAVLHPRKKNAHKGDFGHVLVIGGGLGMPGAVALCAKASLRAGAGAVSVATWPGHTQGVLSFVPEAMIWGVEHSDFLKVLLAKATVCVIGPGLGEDAWARSLFAQAITSQLPMIIDASALRLLAQNPQQDDNWVLTPHPGEAAGLLSSSSAQIQQDRFKAVTQLQQLYGGTVVLKGTGTLIQTVDKNTFVCPLGNPGMASAGMGDVLTGIIAGLCAQGLSLSDAALLGVWAHAAAGDEVAATLGEAGFLASDLLQVVPHVLHPTFYE